jgi:hypothetical protein
MPREGGASSITAERNLALVRNYWWDRDYWIARLRGQ